MTAHTSPVWPQPWLRWRRRLVLAAPFAIAVISGIVIASWKIYVPADHAMGLATIAVTLGVMAGGLPLAFVRVVNCLRSERRRFRLRTLDDATGPMTFAPYPKLASVFLYFAFAMLATMFVVLLWLVPQIDTSRLSARLAGYWNLMGWAGWPLAVACLVLVASYPIRQFRPMGVGMTESGVIVCGWLVCAHWPWDTIDTIQAEMRWQAPVIALGGTDRHATPAAHPAENWLAGIGELRRSATEIGVQHLAVDPAVVLAALCYYRGHPEARHELGTQASVDRIARLDFGDRPAMGLDASTPSADNPSLG